MLSFDSIQATAAAAIAADAYLTNLPYVKVIVARGLEDPVVEDELQSKGCVVVVNPITRAVKKDATYGVLALVCELSVDCIINPFRNYQSDGALRDPGKLVIAVASALMRLKVGPGDNRFEAAEEFVNLSVGEDGVFQYTLFFNKIASFTVPTT